MERPKDGTVSSRLDTEPKPPLWTESNRSVFDLSVFDLSDSWSMARLTAV